MRDHPRSRRTADATGLPLPFRRCADERMDMDRRKQRDGRQWRPVRCVWRAGDPCCRKHSRKPRWRRELDRQRWPFLALWRRGYDAAGTLGYLNDLWEFNNATNPGPGWAAAQPFTSSGVYGTRGEAAAGNMPGSRSVPTVWQDGSGNLWLFGGAGTDQQAQPAISTTSGSTIHPQTNGPG